MTQLIGLAVALARYLQQRSADVAMLAYLQARGESTPLHLLNSHFIITSVGAVFVTFAALAADEALRRGVRMVRAYSLALLAASCVTAIVQWHLRSWLGVDYPPGAGVPIVRLVLVAIDVSLLGGLAMLAYLNRQSAQRMLAGVRTAELERVQIERRLIESRLAAAQAHIDPGSLLGQLAEIRTLYGAAQPAAEARLETLIQELRATVAQSVAATVPRGSAA